jgi:hypothetical protein
MAVAVVGTGAVVEMVVAAGLVVLPELQEQELARVWQVLALVQRRPLQEPDRTSSGLEDRRHRILLTHSLLKSVDKLSE